MSIVIIARWHPRQESKEDFIRAVNGLKDNMPSEIAKSFDTLLIGMSRDGVFVFIEKWLNEEVMNRLRSSELFHEAMRQMSECCDQPLEIEHLSTVDDFNFHNLTPMDKLTYSPGKGSLAYYPDLGAMTPVYV